MYPLFLKLDNKKCLVVGGGVIAQRKVRNLIDAGASVTLISPDITKPLKDMADSGTVAYHRRLFEEGDTMGFFLVIAATNSHSVNSLIFSEASDHQILINCVDDPGNCNFYVPALVNRGALQIAVSTSGKLPVLAGKIKEWIDSKLPQDFGGAIERLHLIRHKIIEESADNMEQKKERIEIELKPEIENMLRKAGLV